MKSKKGSCGGTPRVGKKGDSKPARRGRRNGSIGVTLLVIVAIATLTYLGIADPINDNAKVPVDTSYNIKLGE